MKMSAPAKNDQSWAFLETRSLTHLCVGLHSTVGASRGFAFVEFARIEESQKWMDEKKVSITHNWLWTLERINYGQVDTLNDHGPLQQNCLVWAQIASKSIFLLIKEKQKSLHEKYYFLLKKKIKYRLLRMEAQIAKVEEKPRRCWSALWRNKLIGIFFIL